MFAICHRNSVCPSLSTVVCRLSVTLVHRTQRVELCGDIVLHRLVAYGLGQFVLKISEKIVERILADRAS